MKPLPNGKGFFTRFFLRVSASAAIDLKYKPDGKGAKLSIAFLLEFFIGNDTFATRLYRAIGANTLAQTVP
jgi:hypothetical protein